MYKVVTISSVILFSVFAIVQFNDPDPLLWVSVYTVVAVFVLLSFFKKTTSKLSVVLMGILLIIAIAHTPGFYDWLKLPNKEEILGRMVHKKPYIEQTREFGGSLIALVGIFYQYIHLRKSAK